MPCGNFTETIHVVLDGEDRLVRYALTRRNRGGGVDERALLERRFAGWSMEAILGLGEDEFLAGQHVADETEGVLAWKQFFALRMALEALTGRAAGGVGEQCRIASVIQDADNLHVEADIPIQWAEEKIAARGVCRQCGARKQEDAALRVPCVSRTSRKGQK